MTILDRLGAPINTGPFRQNVLACASSNVVLYGEQTIDGIVCGRGKRVLLIGQTDAKENGPWVVQAGAWIRPKDFQREEDALRAMFVVQQGTSAGLYRIATSAPIAIGSTSLTLAPVSFSETPPDASVTAAKLANGAIESKLGYTPVTPSDLATKVTINGSNSITQDANGSALIINKHSAPLNYGADTRAGFVYQHRDTASLGSNAQAPAVMFDMTFTGNGNVTASTDLSTSIWWGVTAAVKKSGDGSAHAFTVVGELQAYGPNGYNEFGGIQGEMTNNGSMKGTMSGVEFLLKDSPNGGSTSYNTKMFGVIGRIARYNNGARKSYNFYASSEGSVSPDAVLGVNTDGLHSWFRGVDFIGAIFATGEAIRIPNNTSISALTSSGTTQSVFGTLADDNTYARFGVAGKAFQVLDSSNAVVAQFGDGSDAVSLKVGGSLKAVGQGASNSGGAGYRVLIVPN